MGSVLTAQSLRPASDSVSPSLFVPPSLILSLPSFSKISKFLKINKKSVCKMRGSLVRPLVSCDALQRGDPNPETKISGVAIEAAKSGRRNWVCLIKTQKGSLLVLSVPSSSGL